MNLSTQIRADMKANSARMAQAQKRLVKADANARAAATALNAARADVASIESQRDTLVQHLKLEEASASSSKVKPGRSLADSPKTKAAPAKKPGKVATTKGKDGGAVKNKSRAAEGRREVASGKRPPIKETIAKVLGKRVMNSQQVYEAIKLKDQLPNSGDPRAYIGYLLSASKTTIKRGGKDVEVPLFERVPTSGRGFYKNRGVEVEAAPAKVAKPGVPKAAKPAPAPKATKSEAAPKAGKRSVKCGECGASGHNAKGHAKWAAAQSAAVAPKADKAEPKTSPKAESAKTAPKTTTPAEKKQNKCGTCGALGHNAKGHDKAVAKTNGTAVHTNGHTNGTNGTNGHAKHVEPEAEPAPVKAEPAPAKAEASTRDEDKSTDEILAEAGLDLGSPAI